MINKANNRVREVRKALNLTLDEFGKRLGIQKSAVSKIERGDNRITERTLRDICREYNVNEAWLRYGEGDMFVSAEEFSLEKLTKLQSAVESELRTISSLLALDIKMCETLLPQLQKEQERLREILAVYSDMTTKELEALDDQHCEEFLSLSIDKKKGAEKLSA